jgi:hypothetical protein
VFNLWLDSAGCDRSDNANLSGTGVAKPGVRDSAVFGFIDNWRNTATFCLNRVWHNDCCRLVNKYEKLTLSVRQQQISFNGPDADD